MTVTSGTTGGTPRPLSVTARLVAGLTATSWGLPPARHEVLVTRAIPVPGAGGAVLRTDHYAPAGLGPGPAVLIRSPYGRGLPIAAGYAIPYAARGYHVVLQSCRGTFDSPGEFDPMVDEIADGRAAVAWLREQPWFDGRLATIGPSYLGFTQWALAMDPPPEWRAAMVLVAPQDFGRSSYGQGALAFANLLHWADTMAHQDTGGGLARLTRPVRQLTGRRRQRPVQARLPLRGAADRLLGPQRGWYNDWVSHQDLDHPFWSGRRLDVALRRIPVPTMLLGGWYDLFLEQTLEQYRVLRERGLDVQLTVGPWAHLDIAGLSRVIVNDCLAWLDEHVRGEPGRRRARPVRIYVGGAGWRELDAWPPPGLAGQTYHLHPGGGLARRAPAAGGGHSTFRYDPADPTPSVGGPLIARGAGPKDNRALEARPDVLTFTGEHLTEVLEVYGRPAVEVHLSSDNPCADLFVRLCDVDTKGVSRNVCDQNVRLDPCPGDASESEPDTDRIARVVRLRLGETAHRFRAGHRLRLQISGGAFPRFARNLGTGEPPGTATRIRPVTHHVHHDRDRASALVLPVS
jgi:hypothetical protein